MAVLTESQNFDTLISRQEQRLLLVRLQNDDFAALDDLVYKTYAYFFNFLLRLSGEKLDIEAVLRLAYSHFLNIRHRLDSHRDFMPILGRLIFEEVAKAERKPRKKKSNKHLSRNADQYVLKFFRKLPLQQRIVLHLHVLGKLDAATVATILRQRIPEVLPQIAAGRRAFFDSLTKKRIIQPPSSIKSSELDTLFAYPDLDRLRELTPKTHKKVLKSEDMRQFILLIQKCDTLLSDSLAMERCDDCDFDPRQKKLLKHLHETTNHRPVTREIIIRTPSRWRPLWRTVFALSIFAMSIFVWKFNHHFGDENLAAFLTPNAAMSLLSTAGYEHETDVADSLTMMKATIDSGATTQKSTLPDSGLRKKNDETDFAVHVRPFTDQRQEQSAAMTISLRSPRILNPFVATMRKQDMIESIATKIKLWENFFEVTPDSSLYFPHIVQHLAELYIEAADSSGDPFLLADAVAWFEEHSQILASFFGDSLYTVKMDSLNRELQAARTGNLNQKNTAK